MKQLFNRWPNRMLILWLSHSESRYVITHSHEELHHSMFYACAHFFVLMLILRPLDAMLTRQYSYSFTTNHVFVSLWLLIFWFPYLHYTFSTIIYSWSCWNLDFYPFAFIIINQSCIFFSTCSISKSHFLKWFDKQICYSLNTSKSPLTFKTQ